MLPVTDQDLDPLEIADQEEEQHEFDGEGHLIEDSAAIDPEKHLEEDIEKVEVPEETIVKKSGHFLPQEMIDKQLEPDDLCDEGCI